MRECTEPIGSVRANTPSAGLAVVEAAARDAYGQQIKTAGEKNILGGDSVKITDGEENVLAGILAKTKPRSRRLDECRNPTPGTRSPVAPPSATVDPLTVTP